MTLRPDKNIRVFCILGNRLAQRDHVGLREEVAVLGGCQVPVHRLRRLGREQSKNNFWWKGGAASGLCHLHLLLGAVLDRLDYQVSYSSYLKSGRLKSKLLCVQFKTQRVAEIWTKVSEYLTYFEKKYVSEIRTVWKLNSLNPDFRHLFFLCIGMLEKSSNLLDVIYEQPLYWFSDYWK